MGLAILIIVLTILFDIFMIVPYILGKSTVFTDLLTKMKDRTIILFLIIFVPICFLIFLEFSPVIKVAFGILHEVIVIFMLIKLSKNSIKKFKTSFDISSKKTYIENVNRFNEMCKKEKCLDISSKVNLEKAKLIAKQCNLENDTDKIIEYIDYAKNIKKHADDYNRLVKEYNSEIKTIEYNNFVKNKHGREKIVSITNKLYAEAKDNVDRLSGLTYRKNNTKTEMNVLTQSAIGAGLGGLGGEINAINYANDYNKKVQKHNESVDYISNKILETNVGTTDMNTALIVRGGLLKQAEKAKIVYIDDSIETDNYLDISDVRLEKTQTGRMRVSVNVKVKNDLVLDNGSKAVIDGYIVYELMSNGKHFEDVPIGFPQYGIFEDTILSGYSEANISNDSTYSVKMKKADCWLMEKF